MRRKNAGIRNLSTALEIKASELRKRKAYLKLSEKDTDLLHHLHAYLQGKIPDLAQQICTHLLSFDEIRDVLEAPQISSRLQGDLLEYFRRLTAGIYDKDYTDDRIHTGQLQERVGLAPRWYFGAYYQYLELLLPELKNFSESGLQNFENVLLALLKIIFFDLGLSIDAYLYADRQQVLKLKTYAEKVIDSIPSGLLVLDEELNILSANRFFTRMFSLDADVIHGQPVEMLLPIPAFRSWIRQALDNQKAPRMLETNLFGKCFHLSLTVFRPRGDGTQVLLVVEDISKRRHAEVALRETQERFRLLVEGVKDYAIIMLDPSGRIISWNAGAERIYAYSAKEIVGKHFSCFYLREDIDKGLPEKMLKLAREQGRHEQESWHVRKGNSRFSADISITPLWDNGGRLRGFAKITRDVSDQRQAQEVQERFARILQETPDLVATADARGNLLSLNKAGRDMLGIDDNVPITRFHLLDFYFQDARKHIMEMGIPQAIKDGVWDQETELANRNGKIIPVSQVIIAHKTPDGEVAFLSTIMRDISERKEGEARLAYMAHYDALTGLPNRALLMDRLNQVLAYARRHQQKVAVIFVDLDRFKIINDTLGHDAGDLVLKTVAKRLAGNVREEDTLARLGGDEFVVVLSELRQIEDVTRIAEKFQETFSQPILIDHQEFFLSASLGVSIFPDDGKEARTLLKNSDSAMYRAKEEGRNQFRFYTKDMNARSFERLALENSLRRALEREEFLLHYQPKMVLDTGRIIGMEALLRWQHPELGLVPPGKFIPLLEETGLIIPVSEWVLYTACMQTQKWQEAGLPHLRVAVNLSGRQFRQANLLESLSDIIGRSHLDPACLELELTESMLMQNTQETIHTLNKFSEMQVKLALDDFGTGYSSLSYLKRFPVNSLKIDQSFIRDITSDPDDAAITAAITAMAHNLRITVVAEGVETEAQLRFLREYDCDEIQGNFFSRPLSAERFEALISK